MTPEFVYLGVVLFAAFFLFYTHWLRPDITALLILLSLVVPWRVAASGEVTGILSINEAFSGFGSSAVVMIASMFVLSRAMLRTGAAEMVGARLLGVDGGSELRLQLKVLIVVTLFSAVINDTMTVLIWMPLVINACRERGYSPTRFLLIVAYASLLGGQWTLIGTRSNIILSDYLRTHTGEGLGFFSFTPVAACILAGATAYFLLLGRRLLPEGKAEVPLAERYEVAEYLTEVVVNPAAEIIGERLGDLPFGGKEGVSILKVIRDRDVLPPSSWLRIREGDVLVIQGRIAEIARLFDSPHFQVREELKVGEKSLSRMDLEMVEALVPAGSEFEGKSLEEIDFPRRFGPVVLGITRGGRPVTRRLAEHRVRFGDSLLLAARESEIQRLRSLPDLLLLESRPLPAKSRRQAFLVLGLLLMIVVVSSSGLLQPVLAIFLAGLLAILLGCISIRGVYQAIDWGAIVVIGGMIAYGRALEETGTANAVASALVLFTEPWGPQVLFASLLLATVVLTQIVENAAVAVVLAPIAHEAAVSAGLEPVPFILGVAICTSSSFMTPVAHESTILVMTPGRYRFSDYVRAGTPLALLTWLVTALVLPLIYPLSGC